MESLVREVFARKGISDAEVRFSVPVESEHGDRTTNAALLYAKQLNESPFAIAKEIAEALSGHPDAAKVEVAGPGFVNVHLTDEALLRPVAEALSADATWGTGAQWAGKRVLIEKSAPNLFKPFHVGHLLNLTIGESLSRLMRAAGAEVIAVSYPSDISLGVAKAVWSLIRSGSADADLSVHDLGKAYVDGTKAYDEDESVRAEIIEINQKLNARIESPEYALYQRGVRINLDYFVQITERLDSVFDGMFFESESGIVGKEIVKANVGPVFTESDGAIIFKGEDYGLHTRVFVTSKDLPVYEAKDIGLLKLKFDAHNPDLSVVITDVEQRQYFEVIKKAASLINPEWAERSVYWQHGRLRFEGGKISSRYGNVPLAEDLLEQVKERVAERATASVHAAPGDQTLLTEQIAIAALKYAFLKPAAGHNIVFDFERALSLNGDSGLYVQYAHARACSVSRSAEDAGITPALGTTLSPSQRMLARHLEQFPEVMARAASDFAPHHVAQYAGELASLYNGWYVKERVLDDPESAHRLALTRAVATTLRNALTVLGIAAPERL